jgi:small nuclear ribonucleoprotein (snRNP)-like protein
MFIDELSVAKDDVIDMQMSSFDVSMNVFSDESAETDQIDKKIRSKSDVQQSNVDRIV